MEKINMEQAQLQSTRRQRLRAWMDSMIILDLEILLEQL